MSCVIAVSGASSARAPSWRLTLPSSGHAYGMPLKSNVSYIRDERARDREVLHPQRGVLYKSGVHARSVLCLTLGGLSVVRKDWGITFGTTVASETWADWITSNYHERTTYRSMAVRARADYDERLNWDVFCRRLAEIAKTLT